MTQRPADAAASSFGARLRRAGVKTLRLRVSGERAKRGLESDNESDSDDDAGARDGPFVMRCGAVGARGVERATTFEAWRPRRGMDREELAEKYGDGGLKRHRGMHGGLEEAFRGNNIVVRGTLDGVEYVGKNFTHAASGIGRAYERERGYDGKMMLGRLKKASGEDDGAYELELMPIAGGRVIDLETRLRKYNYTEHSKSDLADINDPAVRAEINAKQLEAFASDKRKRQVNRLNAARKLDEASIASPKLMQAHIAEGAATLKSRAELILEAGKTRNIPPHEPNALNLDEAYPIASMPCHALLHKLRSKDLLENADGATDSGEVTFEPLTLALASLCLKTGTKPELNKRAQLIMYADALCKLLARERIKEAKPKATEDAETPTEPSHRFTFTSAENVDPLLQEALIHSYMDEDVASDVRQYVMSKHRRDLVRLQVILIALRLCQWTLEIELVRPHLKVDSKEMMAYTRELGCKSVKGGNNPVVKLDLNGRALSSVLPEIRARGKRAKPKE